MDPVEWREKFVDAKEHGLFGVFLSKSASPEIINEAKKAGLETHTWLMVMARPDVYRETDHDDWFMVNRNGISCAEDPPYVDYYRWLCPNHPEVLPFLRDQITKLASTTHADGIHFDYIRYPDVILPKALQPKYNLVQNNEMPEFDYCYCEYCQTKFKELTGKNILEIKHPEKDRDWREFRLNSITKIVDELTDIVRLSDKKVTAAVFPTPENSRSWVRQDWTRWKLDAVYPMLYHGFYEEKIEWIGDAITIGLDETRCKIPIFAGIFLHDMTPKDFTGTIEIVKSKHGAGISIFNWNDMRPEYWKILKEQFI